MFAASLGGAAALRLEDLAELERRLPRTQPMPRLRLMAPATADPLNIKD